MIYFVEGNPRYLGLIRPLMESIDRGSKRGVSSFVTLAEVLVQPLRMNRADLARDYQDRLLSAPNFRVVPVERAVAEGAARICARHGFRLPDAIGLASAVLARADVFLTNDLRLRAFPDVEVVALDDHTGFRRTEDTS